MPTSRPRYQITDTGQVREMLDLAQAKWPEIRDRKALLLQLAAAGAAELQTEHEDAALAERRAAQVAAFEEIGRIIDVDYLLSDEAWK